jgi:GxxExxY protein
MSADSLIYEDLSYKVRGILFKIQNDLGTKFQEKHYQRALGTLLQNEKLSFATEVPFTLKYNNVILGNFRADVIIEKTILLELKTVDYLTTDHFKQTLRYLEALNLPLGYVVNFRHRPLELRRIINSKDASALSAGPPGPSA